MQCGLFQINRNIAQSFETKTAGNKVDTCCDNLSMNISGLK